MVAPMKASPTMTNRRRRRKLLPSEMARTMASPRQQTNFQAVIPVQRDAQRKNCHPKIEQLKNCQLKIHTLEVFAVFYFIDTSLSEECGEIGLPRTAQSNGYHRSVFEIVF